MRGHATTQCYLRGAFSVNLGLIKYDSCFVAWIYFGIGFGDEDCFHALLISWWDSDAETVVDGD